MSFLPLLNYAAMTHVIWKPEEKAIFTEKLPSSDFSPQERENTTPSLAVLNLKTEGAFF